MSDADDRENFLSVYDDATRELLDLLTHDVPRWAASDERWERIDYTLEQLQRAVTAGDSAAAAKVADHLALLGPCRNARRLTDDDRSANDATRALLAALAEALPRPSGVRTKGFPHVTMTAEP